MPDTSKRPSLEYLDFDLEIGPGDGRAYPVAVLESPSGEARSVMQFPYDEIKLRLHLVELENVLLRSATTRRVASTEDEKTVEQFGSTLFNALFTDEVRNRYEVSLERARMQGKGLRLKLRILAPELAALPWEFLYDLRRSEYLCFSRQTPIVRYPTLPLSIQPMAVTPPLRILAMVASPRGLAALDVRSEKERLSQPLETLRQAGLVELHWLEGQTWRDLQRAMRQGPWHVFHFIGHGGFDSRREEGFLALCDENGDRDDLRATQLARLIADHAPLRLVVLNACEGGRGSQEDEFSSSASILLRGGVPAVLAMQYAITDRAAVEFARTFYEAIADGIPVDTAVAEGRLAISLAFEDTIEWGTPVLYLRAEDGVLFDVQPPAERLPRRERLQPEAETQLPTLKLKEVEIAQPDKTQGPIPLLERMKQVDRIWWMGGATGLVLLCIFLAVVSGNARKSIGFFFPAPSATMSITPTITAFFSETQLEASLTPTLDQAEAVAASSIDLLETATLTPSVTVQNPTGTSTPNFLSTETPTVLSIPTLHPGTTQISTKDGMVMVYIPEGNFYMGCDKDNPYERCDGDNTLHNVYLNSYWIDQTHVTNAMYKQCVDANACENPSRMSSLTRASYFNDPEFDHYPVIYVTWNQAVAYCEWVGRRLPTEAEWEKAARSDKDTRRFPWGNEEPDCSIANFKPGTGCVEDTSEVGAYFPNGASEYGVLDMAGNVWDWVYDYYDAGYYVRFDKVDPRGPENGNYKVMRGGCFINASHSLRVAFRGRREPGQPAWDVGFRCAASSLTVAGP
jgi:formylglycine-generating enzyme required for sulfatase activity